MSCMYFACDHSDAVFGMFPLVSNEQAGETERERRGGERESSERERERESASWRGSGLLAVPSAG